MDRDRRGERERKGRRGARDVDVSNRCRWEGARNLDDGGHRKGGGGEGKSGARWTGCHTVGKRAVIIPPARLAAEQAGRVLGKSNADRHACEASSGRMGAR